MNWQKIGELASSHLTFVKTAFCDNGNPSSSRLLTIPHSLVACGVLIYLAIVTKGHPDSTVVVGLGAFATAHYAVNRATTAFGKQKSDAPPPPQIQQ